MAWNSAGNGGGRNGGGADFVIVDGINNGEFTLLGYAFCKKCCVKLGITGRAPSKDLRGELNPGVALANCVHLSAEYANGLHPRA